MIFVSQNKKFLIFVKDNIIITYEDLENWYIMDIKGLMVKTYLIHDHLMN